jgi:hypothetical protein
MLRDVIERFRYRFEIWHRERREDLFGMRRTDPRSLREYTTEQSSLSSSQESEPRIRLGLKIAAIYLIGSSVFGLAFLLGPQNPEFLAQSFSARLGGYLLEFGLDVACIIAGIGIFRRRTWAPKLGIQALAISIFYGAWSFARGFAGGNPSTQVLAVSFAVVGAWNIFWIYLLSRKPLRDATQGI